MKLSNYREITNSLLHIEKHITKMSTKETVTVQREKQTGPSSTPTASCECWPSHRLRSVIGSCVGLSVEKLYTADDRSAVGF